MEELDKIILHSMRQIGCNIDENFTKLNSINPETVVEIVIKCLKIIKSDFDMPIELSPKMAARIRFCSQLTSEIKDLGYKGQIGYYIFLYPSEVELRQLLLFLMEKFPKEDKIEDKSLKKKSPLQKSIADSLTMSLQKPWVPHYCHQLEVTGYRRTPFSSVRLDVPSMSEDEEHKNYYENYFTSLPEQAKAKENLLPSVLQYNSKLLFSTPTNIIDRLEWIASKQEQENYMPKHIKGQGESFQDDILFSTSMNVTDRLGRITSRQEQENYASKHIKRQGESQDLSKESSSESKADGSVEEETKTEQDIIQSELETLSKECEQLGFSIETESANLEQMNAKLAQITLIQQSEQQELDVLEEQKKIISRTYDLLDDGESNVEKLRQAIETKKSKLIHLVNEWEKSRKPLIQKYRELKENNSNKSKLNERKRLKEIQRELNLELINKEQVLAQLMNDIQKMPKELNRSAYTQGILEIINNIKKQQNEIDKIENDTRSIKKEINILRGRLQRSFEVTTEICKGTQASPSVEKLHSDFNNLIEMVTKTGAIQREIRDLEEQVTDQSAENFEENLKRIRADLKQLKREELALQYIINEKKNSNTDTLSEDLLEKVRSFVEKK